MSEAAAIVAAIPCFARDAHPDARIAAGSGLIRASGGTAAQRPQPPSLLWRIVTGPRPGLEKRFPSGCRMAIQRTSLNVSLTPELERFIAARVASGRYQTASEVVRAALRLLEQNEARDGGRVEPGASGPRGPERA